MNILNIAIKEIKSNFRDIQTFLFYLALPIILMLILGTALSNVFSSEISIDDMTVLYQDDASEELSQIFHDFTKEVEVAGIIFEKETGNVNPIEQVQQDKYDAFIEITDDGIKFYANELNSVEGSIIQGMLTGFADKYNLVQEVAEINPENIAEVLTTSAPNDYIHETSLNSDEAPSSMDYYAIVMTTMVAFFSLYNSYGLLRGEKTLHTADRLLAAPITKAEIFLGKILGSFFINAICIVAVVLFSKYVFKANWGDHLGIVFLILFSEILFAISVGIGISYLAKTPEATSAISVIFIQLACFFGGTYFPFDLSSGGILGFFLNLSPLTWVNVAIKEIIFTGDIAAAIPAISLNLGIGAIFLCIAIFSLRRREGL